MFTSTASPQTGQFSAADRCDRCGARALARVELISGELLFCGHHFRKHRAVLETMSLFPPTLVS